MCYYSLHGASSDILWRNRANTDTNSVAIAVSDTSPRTIAVSYTSPRTASNARISTGGKNYEMGFATANDNRYR